jgi:hypothetical protein
MVLTLGALIGEVVFGTTPLWSAIPSLALVAAAVVLAAVRTVRSAVRLGTQADSAEHQSRLAHAIYRDHVLCFVAIAVTVMLRPCLVLRRDRGDGDTPDRRLTNSAQLSTAARITADALV